MADDVWEAIQALPGKTDDALRLMLITGVRPKADEHAEINRWFRETWSRLEEIERLVVDGAPGNVRLSPAEAARMAKAARDGEIGDEQGGAPAGGVGVSMQCLHCPRPGRKGSSKFATICFECKAEGHTLTPAECPECTAGSAI